MDITIKHNTGRRNTNDDAFSCCLAGEHQVSFQGTALEEHEASTESQVSVVRELDQSEVPCVPGLKVHCSR